MGGSSDSISFRGSRNSYDGHFSCEKIDILSQIASPNVSVLRKTKVGEFLNYEIIENEILIAKYKDEILGSIINSKIQEIINCIKGGTEISVEVAVISDGLCRVSLKTK